MEIDKELENKLDLVFEQAVDARDGIQKAILEIQNIKRWIVSIRIEEMKNDSNQPQ